MAKTFDEKIWTVAKFILVIVAFLIIVIPLQILWFLFYVIFVMFRKKQTNNEDYKTSLNLWTPIELYAPKAIALVKGEDVF